VLPSLNHVLKKQDHLGISKGVPSCICKGVKKIKWDIVQKEYRIPPSIPKVVREDGKDV
jgi:hypothetical protein